MKSTTDGDQTSTPSPYQSTPYSSVFSDSPFRRGSYERSRQQTSPLLTVSRTKSFERRKKNSTKAERSLGNSLTTTFVQIRSEPQSAEVSTHRTDKSQQQMSSEHASLPQTAVNNISVVQQDTTVVDAGDRVVEHTREYDRMTHTGVDSVNATLRNTDYFPSETNIVVANARAYTSELNSMSTMQSALHKTVNVYSSSSSSSPLSTPQQSEHVSGHQTSLNTRQYLTIPQPEKLLSVEAQVQQETHRAATRLKWRKAIKRIAMANRAIAKFEEPVKQRKLNLTKKLSQTLFLSKDTQKGKAKSVKQQKEERALRTVVHRFRLRRKESYVDDLALTKSEKKERDDGNTSEEGGQDIEELEDGDPSAALPPGFGRGLQYVSPQKVEMDNSNSPPGSPVSNNTSSKTVFSTSPSNCGRGNGNNTYKNNNNNNNNNDNNDNNDNKSNGENNTNTIERKKSFSSTSMHGGVGMALGARRMSKRAELILALSHGVVHPQAPFKQTWDIGMFFLIAYLMIAIPYQVAFAIPTPEGEPPSFFDVWDIIVDSLFWCDIILSFNTAYHDATQTLVVSRKLIAKGYLKLWFWIDLLAAIPIDKIVTGLVLGGTNKAVKLVRGVRLLRQIRMLKLLRLVRIGRLLRQKKTRSFSVSRSAHFVKILKLLGVVIFIAHFLSCTWYSMSDESMPESGFLTWQGLENPHMNIYLGTLYHVVAMLISDQGGVEPRSNLDLVFCTLCMLAGSIVISIVFGQMALIISDLNAQKSGFQRKMERLHTSMKYLGLPQPLQQRIYRYYTYLWEQHRSIDGKPGSFVDELSENLSAEVTIYLRRKVIATNLIFSNCYAEELHDIVISLKRSFYLPGDYVLREGAIGQGLYLVHTGEVDVLVTRTINATEANNDGNDIDSDGDGESLNERTIRLSILGPGAHFGSKSLWARKREIASVVARTNCEILILERKKFVWLCAKHKGLTDRVLYDAHSERPDSGADTCSKNKKTTADSSTAQKFKPMKIVPVSKKKDTKAAGA